MQRDVAAGTADGENSVRPLTHTPQVSSGTLCTGEMIVGEFTYGMPGAFVNGSGDFPTLDVGNTEVHIGRRQSRRQSFIAIADEQHQVWFEALKFIGKFHHTKADRFGHRGWGRAFQLHINLAVDVEAVLPYDFHGLLKTFQHHRASGKHLQFEVRMGGDRVHHRFHPPIVGPVYQNDADLTSFPLHYGSPSWRSSLPPGASLQSIRRMAKRAFPWLLLPTSVQKAQVTPKARRWVMVCVLKVSALPYG